jgi:hypothetical protein
VLALIFLGGTFGLFFFVTGPLSLGGLLLGLSGRGRVKRGETPRGRRAAIAAIWFGAAGIALALVGAFITALFLAGYWED